MRRRAKGEGTISYHEPSKRWRAALELGMHDGKRRRKYLYGATRKEVADKLRAAQRQAEKGGVIDERITVAEYLDRWLETVVKVQRRPKTYSSYCQIVRLYITPHIGRERLARLAPESVQHLLNHLLTAGGKDGTPVSPRTVQRTRAVLRAALAKAERWGILVRNVAALTDPPRIERFIPVVLDSEQGQRLLSVAAGERTEALWYVLLLMGLREGEALGLTWDRIDVVKHRLTVAQTLQRRAGEGLMLAPPKTNSSVRTLPVPQVVERALLQHRERQQREREDAANFWVEQGLVFTTDSGRPIDQRNLLRIFTRLLRAAELPRMRIHDLRHSCATMLIASSVHPRVVMEILGHSQISVTMNTYGHVLPEVQREAANAMDRLFLEAGETAR